MLMLMARTICENFYCMMISVRASGIEGIDLEEVKTEISELMGKNGFNLKQLSERRIEVLERNIKQLVKCLNTW
jgi:hypothetical protein